ncbi:hypothetical protein WI460_14705 [Gemmatimonadota bacterium Y43]|uniref:hypothetical protein n=1 Tax=Gaopeijia maritima TaxID=3119007 RepID=UPI0032887531
MSYASGEMRVYQLNHMVDARFLTTFLDGRPEILNWLIVMPGMMVVVSRSDLLALTDILHAAFPWLKFMLTEVQSHTVNGFMDNAVWDFVNNPRSSGRWE